MESIYFLLAIAFALIIVLAVGFFLLLVEHKAMKKSTHSIQYVDPFKELPFEKLTEETKEKLTKPAFDNIM